jgi:hypothetical protein
MAFLSNPIWQFILNVAIGFLTIIVSIIIFRKQVNQKGITYEIISNTPILSLKEDVRDRVQVLFDSKPIVNVRLVILKIWNSGNIPISPYEYHDPIRFEFGKNAEILDTDVLETVPTDNRAKVKASLKLDKESVMLEPLLLNSKDSITLKFLLAGTQLAGEIKVSSRIAGISKITNYDIEFPINPFSRLAVYISYIVFLLAFIYFLFSHYESDFLIKMLYLIFIMIGVVAYVLLMVFLHAINYSLKFKFPFTVSIKQSSTDVIILIKYMIYGK